MLRSKVTAVLSFGMDGFDILAMGVSLFEPSSALVEFNRKLHSNTLYNGFRLLLMRWLRLPPGRHQQ